MLSIRGRWWIILVLLANALLYSSYRIDRAYIKRAAYALADPSWSDERIVEALVDRLRYIPRLSREQVDELPWLTQLNLRFSPLKGGPRTTLEYGTHRAACRVTTRAFTAFIDVYGIKWEPVLLHNEELKGTHGLAEVQFERGPGVIDPLYAIIYRHEDGRPASRKELRQDHDLFVANASQGWQFGYGPDSQSQRLVYPVEEYGFEFPLRFSYRWFGPGRWFVYDSLTKYAGPDGPLLLNRPRWLDWPTLTTMVFLDIVVGLIVVVMGIRRWKNCRRQVNQAFAETAPATC